MHKSTLLFFVLSFALVILTRMSSISLVTKAYAQQSTENAQEEEEKTGEIESEKKERMGEEKLIHPKAYTPISAFVFSNLQRLIVSRAINLKLLPSHHQILERPPKK